MNTRHLNNIINDNLKMFDDLKVKTIETISLLVVANGGCIDFNDDDVFNDNIVCGIITCFGDEPEFDWINKIFIENGELFVITTNLGKKALKIFSDMEVFYSILYVYNKTKIK